VNADAALRRDARDILDAALAGVAPEPLVRGALEDGGILPDGAPVTVLAVGKAALGMAWGAHEALGERVRRGFVLAPADQDGVTAASGVRRAAPPRYTLRRGGHPLPTAGGVAAAHEMVDLLRALSASDVLLALVSGGMSSLAALPAIGITLDDYRSVTELLLRAGAPIHELNTVRKHIDALKGGRAAALAAPARVVSLLISDVVGNDPGVIASGPFAPDPTRYADALEVLRARQVLDAAPVSVRRHLEAGARGEVEETPSPDANVFDAVTTEVIADNALALLAAARRAEALGYPVRLLDAPFEGEARTQGTAFADLLLAQCGSGARLCLLRGGETTVTVRGQGRGGRNQEFALAAALRLAGRGGVLVGAGTVRRGQEAGVEATSALDDDDAYTFFAAEGGLVRTGATGVNVMDVAVGLCAEAIP
jgi:glycerate-2-kinase